MTELAYEAFVVCAIAALLGFTPITELHQQPRGLSRSFSPSLSLPHGPRVMYQRSDVPIRVSFASTLESPHDRTFVAD